MDQQQLRNFLAVAERGSFSGAEKDTYLTRQALIKQIGLLEKELGFPLFCRTTRGVTLTPAGKEFHTGAKRLLRQMDALTTRCRDVALHTHVLRIENPPQARLLLETPIHEFARRYPYIKLEVEFRKGDDVISRVLDGTVDVAESIFRPEMDHPELDYTLISTGYRCLVSENHPLAGRPYLELSDLSGQTVGLSHWNSKRFADALAKHCSNLDLMDVGYEDVAHIYNVCLNRGIFITMAYFASHLPPLVAIPLRSEVSTDNAILYRRNPAPAVRDFLEIVGEFFKEKNH